MAATPKTERKRKTPEERAQHELDVATRRVEKLTAKYDDLGNQREAVNRELAQATKRRDYLAQSPDLPQPTLDGGEATEPLAPRAIKDQPQA